VSGDKYAPLLRRDLEDGRIVELHSMIFNYRITITSPENDGTCYDDMWCWKGERLAAALAAFAAWNGEGEPDGWNKHPPTGRWREDGTPATEINQRDDQPSGGAP
jgi:hypothetical protein